MTFHQPQGTQLAGSNVSPYLRNPQPPQFPCPPIPLSPTLKDKEWTVCQRSIFFLQRQQDPAPDRAVPR